MISAPVFEEQEKATKEKRMKNEREQTVKGYLNYIKGVKDLDLMRHICVGGRSESLGVVAN